MYPFPANNMNITLADGPKSWEGPTIGGPRVLKVGGTGPPGPHGGCAYAHDAPFKNQQCS